MKPRSDDTRSDDPGRPAHFPDGTQLADVDDALLDVLVENVRGAADRAVIAALIDAESALAAPGPAERTRIAVRAAIRNGLRNGALAIAPADTWPERWECDA